MKHNIFGKDIITKDYHCAKNTCNDLWKVQDPYVNIYVKVTEHCNAHCKFCEFCERKENKFNLHKYYYILSELQKIVAINKISFTGGELTMRPSRFKQIMEKTREVCPKSFTVVNTNGFNIDFIMEMDEVDNVSLSRHHYDDDLNSEVFGVMNVPTADEIRILPNKDKIHFSCNLIKNYIDSREEIVKFLEWSASVGVMDVGFVTLMQINNFCIENHIDFRDIDITQGDSIFHYQTWKNGNTCECRNYMFNPQNNEGLVKVYARYMHDYLKGNESNLVFDGQYLRNGFYGEIII